MGPRGLGVKGSSEMVRVKLIKAWFFIETALEPMNP